MDNPKQHALIMWIVWFIQLQAAFIFQLFLGGGFSQGENAETPMALWLWVICLVPLVLATGIRWLLIPKIKQFAQQLVAMIIGLTLAEASVFLSIFLVGPDYPQYQIAILMVAVVALIQFAPSYATPGYKPGT
ncbi:MAG: hypothetical protein GVY36_05190 [Verrucomicrobia bacterium]|jgi:hypothetical protein|nr:hypothetical protein [Verrucomicrobiota bacterium]